MDSVPTIFQEARHKRGSQVEGKSDAPHVVEAPASTPGASDVDVVGFNSGAWDHQVRDGNPWTRPVRPDEVDAARRGDWSIVLTPTRPVPREWFGTIQGANVLCLASGGGQQGPILAAAGANVTVFDNSPAQLAQDRHVAERDSLTIRLELGQMEDLSRFSDAMFDLIVHPVSNLFTPNVRRVWHEGFRVLRRGGSLLAGFANPVRYLFDAKKADSGEFVVRHPLPYSDVASLPKEELAELLEKHEPLEFGHSLEDQIGGQIEAGFLVNGFYEDRWPGDPLDRYFPPFIATRAVKP
jgi:SAM-dependent methyltransferase